MHATRTWHYRNLDKAVKTRTKSLFIFTLLWSSYRFFENSHAKRPSHKQCEGEICKKVDKIHKNWWKIYVLRMRPLSRKHYNVLRMQPLSWKRDANAQMRSLSRKRCKVLRMRPVTRKRHTSAQMRPLARKRHRGVQKTVPVDKIALRCAECEHCRVNCIWTVRMRNNAEIALRTNIGFVTIDLYAKYGRNRIGNEHRVCNHWSAYEIPQKSDWERT